MRRTFFRIGGYLGAVLLLALCAGAAYFYGLKPSSAKPTSIRVQATAERLKRGKYIYALADCDGCHSERDFTRFGGPVVESGRGKGFVFPAELGMPGRIASSNITPDPETGLGNWTDGEKIRAIREGISRDGHVLFPMMGYTRFRDMSDEDVESLVAYLNTLKPIRNYVPRSKIDFPVSMLIRTAPKPTGRVASPDRKNTLKYGEYLATLGGCDHCHTASGGQAMAGGQPFKFPGMQVVSANITADPDTGIGAWTADFFVSRFTAYKPYVEKGAPKATPETFTVMPWLSFSELEPDDLRAIYAYLRTQPAVSNRVATHPPVLRASVD